MPLRALRLAMVDGKPEVTGAVAAGVRLAQSTGKLTGPLLIAGNGPLALLNLAVGPGSWAR